ncbi:hypothetical protein J4G08_19485 [Candidatus Poribacteria bacterium]|nr:hypothetical protein [Candidatus Poribacteria bacterium]
MLKKIGYILLGGFVATIGYIAGSIDNIGADNDWQSVKKLHVEESILIGDANQKNNIVLSVDGKTCNITLISEPFPPAKNIVSLTTDEKGSMISTRNKNTDRGVTLLSSNEHNLVRIIDASGEKQIRSSDSPSKTTNAIVKPTTGAITVELVTIPNFTIKDGKAYISDAVVQKASGEKMHVTFIDPLPPNGMFNILDKISIKPVGNKWKFVKFVKSSGF